jgi:NAD-dependent DNA ligase
MSETIFYNQDRVEDRSISEMIGISKGLVADGVINEFEAEFLVEWVKNNAQLTCWPFNVLQNRIGVMLEDGVIDSHEREELFSLLKSLIGEKPVAEHISSFATTLPLTKPVPKILFEGKSFCFTGKFAYGLRKDCEKAVELRGGVIADNVTKNWTIW